MWMQNQDDRNLIKELAYDVVAKVAPEELEDVDFLIDDYFDHPIVASASSTSGDVPLGSDFIDPVLLTQVVAPGLVACIALLIEAFKDVIKSELSETVIKPAVKRLLRRDQAQRGDMLEVKSDVGGTPQSLTIVINVSGNFITANVDARQLTLIAEETAHAHGHAEHADEIARLILDRIVRNDDIS